MEKLEMKHAFGHNPAVAVSGIRRTSINVAASRNQADVAGGAAQWILRAPHLCPSKPRQLCPRTCISRRDSEISAQGSIASTPWAGSRAPVHSLMAARGWRHLSLVLPTCSTVMFETLAEIHYRPISAPSVAWQQSRAGPSG